MKSKYIHAENFRRSQAVLGLYCLLGLPDLLNWQGAWKFLEPCTASQSQVTAIKGLYIQVLVPTSS